MVTFVSESGTHNKKVRENMGRIKYDRDDEMWVYIPANAKSWDDCEWFATKADAEQYQMDVER